MSNVKHINIPLFWRPFVGLVIGIVGLVCLAFVTLCLAFVACIFCLMPLIMLFTPRIEITRKGSGFKF